MIVLAAPCALAFSCAGTWGAVKSSAWPAGGSAAGAVVGSTAGPLGTVAGAAIGGGAGHMIGENAALRSGEIQGSGAADREAARWRDEAFRQGDIATSAWLFLKRCALLSALYFLFLRREWVIRVLQGPDRLKAFLHIFAGGKRTRPK